MSSSEVLFNSRNIWLTYVGFVAVVNTSSLSVATVIPHLQFGEEILHMHRGIKKRNIVPYLSSFVSGFLFFLLMWS